jgi:hypothetical protein
MAVGSPGADRLPDPVRDHDRMRLVTALLWGPRMLTATRTGVMGSVGRPARGNVMRRPSL